MLSHLGEESESDVGEGTDEVSAAIVLFHDLVIAVGDLADLVLGGVAGRSQQKGLVVGESLNVLDLLLAVEHLPALDAQDFSIALLLDGVELVDENVPRGRVALGHSFSFNFATPLPIS